jgi:drug/metabolite transporter (DMT)-like permease
MLSLVKSGLFVAIVAHGLIGASLVWDKVLLERPETQNVFAYVFWLGAMSVLGLLLMPFGFHVPSLSLAALAFGTGVLHLVSIFFYYVALKRGEASQALAIMGGFSPVATALIGLALLPKSIEPKALLGFMLLTAGGFVMFLSERFNLRRILLPVMLASGLYGLVNVLQKTVFNHTNFVTGYVMFTFGTFVGALLLLVRPGWRRQIFSSSQGAQPRSRFWYFVNRFISGVGSFLVFYAISLANPAIVDSISGVRYALIFTGAYLLTRLKPEWLRENFTGWVLAGKLIATALIVIGLVQLGLSGTGEAGGSGPAMVIATARPRPPRCLPGTPPPSVLRPPLP